MHTISRKKLVATLLLLLGLAGCQGKEQTAKAARPARGLAVRTAPITARDVVYEVKSMGSLEPEELVHITAEVSGAVKEVLFQAGDKVSADTVLARIDPDRYRFEAARAEGSYRRAVADWKRAEADLARREALEKERLVAVEELGRVRQETEKLAADAAAAKAVWDLALQNEQRASVRAPRSGEINTRTVDPGQFVQTGNVLATLVEPRRVRLRFRVSDAESLKAREGERVMFRVPSLGEKEFSARIYHVAATADPATRQVEVLAWVDSPTALKPGIFAEVKLATGTNRGSIVVPESAVQASERGFVVYVVEGGRAKERPVKIGLRTGDASVEILAGVAPGEVLVTEGSDRLTDGVLLEPVEAGPAPTKSAVR